MLRIVHHKFRSDQLQKYLSSFPDGTAFIFTHSSSFSSPTSQTGALGGLYKVQQKLIESASVNAVLKTSGTEHAPDRNLLGWALTCLHAHKTGVTPSKEAWDMDDHPCPSKDDEIWLYSNPL